MAAEHNRYELLERIGVGGMAEVFRARMVGPAGFQKVVALKRILEDFSSDQDFLHRFVDEARLTARLQHPNICQVLDFGTLEGRYFLTLEFVHGLDLAQVLARLEYHGDDLAPRLCLMIVAGVLRGLDHAHKALDEQGRPLVIVHRDVSPQNVLLSRNGDIKLSDFGAAKANAAFRQARTQENIALGKLAYMAPEQRRGKPVDGRADVYGAGVLLAEMLQGPTLFRRGAGLSGPNRMLIADAANERFPAALAPRVAALLERSLDEHPDRRFDDAASMLSQVERCATELGERASPDHLGRLVQKLMNDEEFADEQRAQQRVPRPAPRPQAAVTRNIGSGRQDRGERTDDPDADRLTPTLTDPALPEAPTAPPEGEELVTQVMRGRGGDDFVQDIDTLVTHGPLSADFEQLETQVVRGAPETTEDISTQVRRGGRPTPAPAPVTEDLRMHERPRAEAVGPAPPAAAPAWSQPAAPPAPTTGPRQLEQGFDDDPTEVEKPPRPWLDAMGQASGLAVPAASVLLPPKRPTPAPAAAPPAPTGLAVPPASVPLPPMRPTPAPAAVPPAATAQPARLPSAEETALVRRYEPQGRRGIRIALLLLLIAVILAALGAWYVTRWMAERDRSPWPPETTAPIEPSPAPPATEGPAPQEPPTLGPPPDAGPASAAPPAPAPRRDAPSPRRPAPEPRPQPPATTERPAAQPTQPAGEGQGQLTITAEPPGRAYVDGRLVGTRTPVRATSIAPGEHRVMVVYSSTGRSESRTVRVRPGEHTTVRFSTPP